MPHFERTGDRHVVQSPSSVQVCNQAAVGEDCGYHRICWVLSWCNVMYFLPPLSLMNNV